MKKTWNFLFILLIIWSCSSKSKNSEIIEKAFITQDTTISIESRVSGLIEFSNDLKSEESQIKFFRYFPDSFNEFNQIFGYDEINEFEANFGPLYESSGKYIEALFQLNIDERLVVQKVIDISIGAHWEPDAVNHFQSLMRSMLKKNISLFLDELSDREESQIFKFWYFYFDGSHPMTKFSDDLSQVKLLNEKIYNLMLEAHEKVLKTRSDH